MKLLLESPHRLRLDDNELVIVLKDALGEDAVLTWRERLPRCPELLDLSVSDENARKVAYIAQDYGLVIPEYTETMIEKFCSDKSKEFDYPDTLGILQLS
jgi:hypothetical protein